ncbi:MAG: hypothetical protein H6Q33_3842 [Deltaproteobacteria bacterium]|nr:hypothetical protein [Deltaproteobacteria bacterium]
MTYDELIDFLERKMRMSHIYQPLLIRTLVDAGGAATLRQLAHAFVAQDESQLRFYEDRIKRMPVPVLSGHGVVKREGDFVSLTTKFLTSGSRQPPVSGLEGKRWPLRAVWRDEERAATGCGPHCASVAGREARTRQPPCALRQVQSDQEQQGRHGLSRRSYTESRSRVCVLCTGTGQRSGCRQRRGVRNQRQVSRRARASLDLATAARTGLLHDDLPGAAGC